jgi:hypothetical protein
VPAIPATLSNGSPNSPVDSGLHALKAMATMAKINTALNEVYVVFMFIQNWIKGNRLLRSTQSLAR